jgi:hypothetical protein
MADSTTTVRANSGRLITLDIGRKRLPRDAARCDAFAPMSATLAAPGAAKMERWSSLPF